VSFVLDASAVLAVLFEEAGREAVLAHGQGGTISAVNMAEVLTRAADKDVPELIRAAIVGGMALNVVAFDAEAATAAADLRGQTRQWGLSLGDRACLALGQKLRLPVLTGDRAWAEIDLSVEIVLIR
jgi:ribonuclease VapC